LAVNATGIDFNEYQIHRKKITAFSFNLSKIPQSPDGLQHCLDGLQNYSSEWRLAVNFQKTKVIVFSRLKLPSDKYYFYYGPNSIEIIENYKYLGVIFNYNGRFQLAASSLADKAKLEAPRSLHSSPGYNNNISQ
jgi:hypothetical protein